MMMIGNNSCLHQALGGGLAQQKPQTPNDPQRNVAKGQMLQPQPQVVYAPEEEREVIHRSR